MNQIDIFVISGILIRDKKILVVRSVNEDTFIVPGGRVEEGESATQTLIREIQEECGLTVGSDDLERMDAFLFPAFDTNKTISSEVFLVKNWQGEPHPGDDIEELKWVDSTTEIKVGNLLKHHLLALLKERNIID